MDKYLVFLSDYAQHTIIDFLDIIHHPVFYIKSFGDLTVSPSSGKKPTHLGPIDRAN
jgi:hypothetical protein